ncbi:MAG: hypothetical protein RM338_06715 [Nostoc sp. DedQUE12a]|nr:hypothetical protein [Nostoc sp. DedQUE12a]
MESLVTRARTSIAEFQTANLFELEQQNMSFSQENIWFFILWVLVRSPN